MVANQDREFAEEVNTSKTGLTEPHLGPSDSSDSATEMPADSADTDSDRNNTGERSQVENTPDESAADDIEPDRIVPEDEAGLARTPPDPTNGGE
jgi:hypothetical protein